MGTSSARGPGAGTASVSRGESAGGLLYACPACGEHTLITLPACRYCGAPPPNIAVSRRALLRHVDRNPQVALWRWRTSEDLPCCARCAGRRGRSYRTKALRALLAGEFCEGRWCHCAVVPARERRP